jgi:hypothetical protein
MPIPKRNEGEDKDKFLSRCISSLMDEYDQPQASAICYEQLSVDIEEVYVLKPRKNENRSSFLQRCSRNKKMKVQTPDLKSRLMDCMNSFNSYYKYWSKMEDFGEIPKKSTLGECITREKAKGVDYRTAYASCSTKVVSPNVPVILEEDNLIVEPVLFGDVISIDFDDTLSTERGQKLAKKIMSEGGDLHIVTRRSKDESEEVYKIGDQLGIPHSKIHFTNGEMKWKTLEELGVVQHIDNNPDEIELIEENTDIEPIKFYENKS